MTRLREKDLQFKGEITVFVSLVFMLMLSLIMALLSSAATQIQKSSVRAKMTLALESVFAEYDQELLKQYEVFARGEWSEEMLNSRLQYYGIVDVEHEVCALELLTDQDGLPFYQGAVRYMKDWIGMEGTLGEDNAFRENDSVKEMEEQVERELDRLVSEGENPLGDFQEIKKASIVSLVVNGMENVSEKEIEVEDLPSHRELKKGEGTFEEQEGAGGTVEKVMFAEYLLEHFLCATDGNEEKALQYELEYLLCGEGEDQENLEGTLKKILYLRMGVNYAYLLTDEVKKAEAGAMATGLSILLTTPGAAEIVKQALLVLWAYGESVMDLKVLLKKEKVPLVKTSETWQLQLSNLTNLGDEAASGGEKGMSYEDYVRGLLLLEKRETLCMRSLDLIEKNLDIKVDECATKVLVKSQKYGSFETEFYYQ